MNNAQNDENHDHIVSKETLLAQLDWVRKSYLLGFTVSFLLSSADIKNIMKGTTLGLSDDDGAIIETVDLNYMIEILSDDKRRKNALHSFLMFQVKTSTSEPFELIKDYCESTCDCKKGYEEIKTRKDYKTKIRRSFFVCKETCNMAKWKKLKFYQNGRN